jgi:hypothetical protein
MVCQGGLFRVSNNEVTTLLFENRNTPPFINGLCYVSSSVFIPNLFKILIP